MESKPQFGTATRKLSSKVKPQIYHLPNWESLDDRGKLDVINEIIEQYGRDPRVAQKAVEILKAYGVKPREYVNQAKALLHWCQQNIYYVNEPKERLQSPYYTLKSGIGDCDDLVILLCSFFHSLRLPYRLVISGIDNGNMIRYAHGSPNYPQHATFTHIYCMVGNQPFTPTKWYYCEPTLDVPLGWDVVASRQSGGGNILPELGGVSRSMIAGATAERAAERSERTNPSLVREIVIAVIVGSLTALGTELLIDHIKSGDWYQGYMKRRQKRMA